MKRMILEILLFAWILAGCAKSPATPTTSQTTLVVTGGTITKSYTVADLQKLDSAKASWNNVEYVGVPLSVLLKDAGFDPGQVKMVQVIASDGYTDNYAPALFNKADTLVAYARSDGPLTADDGIFRMVLPGQVGNLEARKLIKIQVTP
jgi:DMSO/TMAO reductase YedYZ molybdopterin-dependent catalytic subunit